MERKPYPSETQERFIVRFPDGMRDRIAEAAKTNNRSMNAEIIARLQQSFEEDAAAPRITKLGQDPVDEQIGLGKQHLLNRALAIESRIASLQSILQGMRTQQTIVAMSKNNPDASWLDSGIRDTETRITESVAEMDKVRKMLETVFSIDLNDIPDGNRDSDRAARRAKLLKEMEKSEDEMLSALIRPSRDLQPMDSRLALIKNLGAGQDLGSDNDKPSRTPKIPGVNVPKRGSKK